MPVIELTSVKVTDPDEFFGEDKLSNYFLKENTRLLTIKRTYLSSFYLH